jgi:hypothetical protein
LKHVKVDDEITVRLPRAVLEALMQAADVAAHIGQQHADVLAAHGTETAEARRQQAGLMEQGKVLLRSALLLADNTQASGAVLLASGSVD